MSALVTEAHQNLAGAVWSSVEYHKTPHAAQLIADSEAKATATLRHIIEVTERSRDTYSTATFELADERDQLTAALDMMRDEFMRIIACPGCNAEIGDLANRAQLKLIQRVPVIVQRERAEAELAAEREKVRLLRDAVERIEDAARSVQDWGGTHLGEEIGKARALAATEEAK